MTETNQERFYNLLPVLYRQRDLESNQSLRALLALLENQYRTLESDISAGYDNWFIQTCDKWVIPYLAELIGINDLGQDSARFPTRRRQVANTIGYRRRKGTPATLEHVLRDASGWSAHAVEFFRNVAMTQQLARVRLDRGKTIDLHDNAALAEAEGPFDRNSHTADVHRLFPLFPDEAGPGRRQGRFPIQGLGLFFWRLRSYRMRDCPLFPVKQTDAGRFYTFNPLGAEMPLFNYPQLTTGIAEPIQPVHIPLPLKRAELEADLLAYQEMYHDLPEQEWPADSRFYGPARSFHLCLVTKVGSPPEYQRHPISPMKVMAADLSHWDTLESFPLTGTQSEDRSKVVAIDVESGRLAWLDPQSEGELVATYCYGFSDQMGGGPYHRQMPPWIFSPSNFRVEVGRGLAEPRETQIARVSPDSPDWPHCVPDLKQALDCWDRYCSKLAEQQQQAQGTPEAGLVTPPRGVVRIIDNGVYDDEVVVKLPAGAQLVLIADNGTRPVIRPKRHKGNIIVECVESSPPPDQNVVHVQDRQFIMNGILVEGGLQVRQTTSPDVGGLQVALEHSTLVPPPRGSRQQSSGLRVEPPWNYAGKLSITIDHCIAGPLELPVTNGSLTVSDSIVDGGNDDHVAIAVKPDLEAFQPGLVTALARTTVFGRVQAHQLTATDVIFTGRVDLDSNGQARSIHHCYVPPDSTIPDGILDPSVDQGAPPEFTATRYGAPGYGQLSIHCPREIRTGALDGGELGVFHDLYSAQAEANARAAIEEYLPLDQDYGIYFVT